MHRSEAENGSARTDGTELSIWDRETMRDSLVVCDQWTALLGAVIEAPGRTIPPISSEPTPSRVSIKTSPNS